MFLGRQILQIYAPVDYRDYILKIISILILFYYLFFAELANCETTYYAPDGTMVTKEEFEKISKDYSNKASTKQTMANNLKSIEDKTTKSNPKKITNDTSQGNSVDDLLRRMSERYTTDRRYGEQERIQEEANQNKASLYGEQARIQSKADQNKASFRDELAREFRKKLVHDVVYGDSDYPLPPLQPSCISPPLRYSPPLQPSYISPPLQSPMTEWEMKKTVKDAIREERQNSQSFQHFHRNQ